MKVNDFCFFKTMHSSTWKGGKIEAIDGDSVTVRDEVQKGDVHTVPKSRVSMAPSVSHEF